MKNKFVRYTMAGLLILLLMFSVLTHVLSPHPFASTLWLAIGLGGACAFFGYAYKHDEHAIPATHMFTALVAMYILVNFTHVTYDAVLLSVLFSVALIFVLSMWKVMSMSKEQWFLIAMMVLIYPSVYFIVVYAPRLWGWQP